MNKRTYLALLIGLITSLLAWSAQSLEVALSESSASTLTITFNDGRRDYRVFSLDNPARLVVDIGSRDTLSGYEVSGEKASRIVKAVRHGKRDDNRLRVVFDISDRYRLDDFDWRREKGQMILTVDAIPQHDCKPNDVEVDVCQLAREIARTNASQLPLQISHELTFDKITPSGDMLHVFGLLAYTEDEIKKKGSRVGYTLPTMRKKTETHTRNAACDEQGMKPFIELGGKVQYHFRFRDGKQYHVVTVAHCR